jgi:hypothetical protein
LKQLQEKIGKTLEDIDIGNHFLNRTPIAQEIRARIDKWYNIKLKSFCTSEETLQETHRMGEILHQLFSDKGLISRI